jgi:hypothetical protein
MGLLFSKDAIFTLENMEEVALTLFIFNPSLASFLQIQCVIRVLTDLY